jgi:hypothetical protein
VRLEFKFRESASPERRRQVVAQVAKLGATTVEPLFPGEQDPELASLYKAEGVPDELTDQVVSTLDKHDDVEFAEPTAERKLLG